mgnify:CR=1 FL=1
MNFALQNTAIDPIHQFQVTKWLDLSIGGVDISFTNASGFMLLGVVLCIAFFGYAASKKALVPGRTQSMAEIGTTGHLALSRANATTSSQMQPFEETT